MTDLNDIATLEARLSTRLLGHPLQYLPSVDSTQRVARTAALAGTPEGLAVIAGQQTAGRGRVGREWWSPPDGGLYLSLLLRPDLPAERLPWLTMCLALGAAEAVEAVCGLRPGIKWPNDLQLNGRKLAGILSEGSFSRGHIDFVVAGLGLNVNVDFSQRPDLRPIATSLLAELGRPVDVARLLVAILARVETHYLALKAGISPQPAWKRRLITLGQTVEAVMADGQRVVGLASDVLSDGALRIEAGNGSHQIVRAADVSIRTQHER